MSDDKALLHDLVSEQSLVGAALVAGVNGTDLISAVDGQQLTGSFYYEQTRKIWGLLVDMQRQGVPLELGAVATQAKQQGVINVAEMAELAVRLVEWQGNGLPALANHYASQIRQAHARRLLITHAREIATMAETDSRPLIETVPALIGDLMRVEIKRRADSRLPEVVSETIAEIEQIRTQQRPSGVPTGLTDLDRHIGGLHKGDQIIIAGRPSSGKSSFVNTIMLDMLRRDIGVGLISAEMNRQQVVRRFISQMTGVPVVAMFRGTVSDQQADRLAAAGASLSDMPLQIEDGERSWPSVQMRINRMVGNGAEVIFIDYLGMLSMPAAARGSGGKQEPRWMQVSIISKEMKELAERLHIPLVAVVQITRESVKDKGNKEPQLHHLRESGSIEEDSDMVMMLHRPAVYDQMADDTHALCLLRKWRNGPIGSIDLSWRGKTASFGDYQKEDSEEVDGDDGAYA